MSAARAIAAALALALAGFAAAAQPYNWDGLGAEFCARSTAGDLAGLEPLLSPSLVREIEVSFARAGAAPPPMLFQSYATPAPMCTAETRNVAIIAVTRSGPGGAPPSWTEYLVVGPEADGTMRIDEVLFATRRSDTLRARLRAIAR